MILVRNIVLVLQKSKQAKTRVDLKRKRFQSKYWIVFFRSIQTFNAWVAAWRAVNTHSQLNQAGKFPATWIVGPKSCGLNRICPVTTAPQIHSLDVRTVPLYNLSCLTIFLKSPLFMLSYFYEKQIPYSKSASKTWSHIQSTAKYIFLRGLTFWRFHSFIFLYFLFGLT